MANTQSYTGTPEQIAKQIGILPRTTKYRATLIPEETEPKKHTQEEIALANQRTLPKSYLLRKNTDIEPFYGVLPV